GTANEGLRWEKMRPEVVVAAVCVRDREREREVAGRMGKKKGFRVFVFYSIITDGLAVGNYFIDACETRRFIKSKKRSLPTA
ncbi:hypothetical protein PIB30_082848, partial [Stylosanthes scabra]|nr:hypothetical protein [Stylosanthes scabra]